MFLSQSLKHAPSNLSRIFSTLSGSVNSVESRNKFECVILGGGIVGLATAREMKLRYPKLRIAVLEKEEELSLHQSKNNSGVIHAGIYYAPGSLRASLCVDGLRKSYEYLTKKKILHKRCGKLIVATQENELPQLRKLYQNALANGVPNIHLLNGDQIKEIEPVCSGLEAIYSADTGIVDWRTVALSFATDFMNLGGIIYENFHANRFGESIENPEYPLCVTSKIGHTVHAKYLIACCGLQSDRVAALTGCSSYPKIVPFRGEYLKLKKDKQEMIHTNIYPVPDPRFPFLGVHFTPRIDGSVWLGPNAVLSFNREGYKKFDVNLQDSIDTLTYPGFWKLARKYFMFGTEEFVNSLIMRLQVRHLQRFVPSLRVEDVERGPCGIRAQALDQNGKLVEDFVVEYGSGALGDRIMNVRNAPSPAATSSLSISCMIADTAKEKFDLPTAEERSFV